LDDRALQFERLKYGRLTNDERGRKLAEVSQMSLSQSDQRALVVTEANSRTDLIDNYSIHAEVIRENSPNLIKNDEVDELIEWTQCLPNTDENLEEN